LPTVGAIGEQTIAGAIATATHGSGKPSLSHYVSEVRVATYDENRRPVLRRIRGGRELEAARCALGRMGVVLRVQVRCTTAHCIEEITEKCDSRPLAALSRAQSPDATQCYLIPWAWSWVVQRRRRLDVAPASALAVLGYRAKRFLLQTIGVDLVTWLFARVLRRPGFLKWIYPRLFRFFKRISIVAHAERVLLSKHRLRYAEAEVFVPVARVERAADFIEAVLRYTGDDAADVPQIARELMRAPGELESLQQLRNRYVHHYPITFRRVQRDDTLISMTNDEDRYAISLISFARPGGSHFEEFESVIRLLARTMEREFRARWHWGKLLPLEHDIAATLAPALVEFADECRTIDPDARFRSAFSERVLGV
jgi:L-gulonolactone oxidase